MRPGSSDRATACDPSTSPLDRISDMSHEVRSMRMVITILVAGSLAIASQEGRSAEALLHDPVYGFSVTAPTFPKQDDEGISVTPVSFNGPIHDGKAPSCNVQVQNMGATLSSFRTQSLGQLKALGLSVESETPRKVSGKDALLLVSSGHDVKIISLAVQVRRSIYLVTCLASRDQFPSYEEAFHGVIDSFSVD